MFIEKTWSFYVSTDIIEIIINMLRLSNKKQFTWKEAAFLSAQNAEKIQEQEEPLLKVPKEIPTNLADLKKRKVRNPFDN